MTKQNENILYIKLTFLAKLEEQTIFLEIDIYFYVFRTWSRYAIENFVSIKTET